MTPKNNSNKNKSKAHNYRFRVGRIFQVIIALVFLIFVVRFLYIGLSNHVGGQNIEERVDQKYRQNITLKANRGTIYDKKGQVIVEDSHVYSVYAVLDKSYINSKNKPLYVVDKKKTATQLATVLPMTADKILAYLTPKKSAYQVEFGNAGQGLTLAQKKKIEAMKLTGIYFNEIPSRLYPNGDFASNTVGLAQIERSGKNQTENLVGTMGIEKYFDNILAGTDGLKEAKVDSYGYELPNAQKVLKPSKDGENVYLTLDTRLQSYLEDLMNTSVAKYKPLGITAVLEEAKTGKILAASQRPSFNPTTKSNLTNAWRNRMVEDSFEPGSVMKILTLATAIETGVYNPNEYYQSGAVNVMGSTIRDWNISGWGSIPFSQAFPRSSNVGFVKLQQKIGGKTWGEYLDKFGITKKTGMTLPGEVTGSNQFKTALDQAVTAFGQGVNVNVMQMLQAFSSVANEGQMIKPQLVEKITDSNGKTVSSYETKKVGSSIFSKATADLVIENMKAVVNSEVGTGQAYKIEGQDIAVKTGTAQLANPNGGGYLTGINNYIFSVVGMAPASNPKYILYLTVKQPQKMTQAAETIMGEIFKPLMKRVLEYDQADTTPAATAQVTVPQLTTLTPSIAVSTATNAGLVPIIIGDGQKVLKQNALAGAKINAGEKIFIYSGGMVRMPDMVGWTLAQVQAFQDITGIKFKINGTGHVVSQTIKEKTLILSASQPEVTLKE